MRDEVKDYPSDPNAQKSVSDWLMHVISGKAPLDGQPDHTVQPKSNAEESLRVAGAVAVEEMPGQNGRAKVDEEKKKEMIASEFTAEDLCGPAVFKMPASPAVNEEITADDLCFVPKSEEMKPHRNGTSSAAPSAERLWSDAPVAEAQPEQKIVAEVIEIRGPEQNGIADVIAANEPKHEEWVKAGEVTQRQQEPAQKVESKEAEQPAARVIEEKKPEQYAADFLMRDRVRYSGAPPDTARFSRKPVEPAGDREITVADILRDRVLRQMQPPVEPFQAKPRPVAPEPEAIADVVQKEELPAEQVAPTETVVAGETGPPEVEAEVRTTAPVDEPKFFAEPLPSAEPQVIEVAAAAAASAELFGGAKAEFKTEAPAADAAKSVFAQEGIWGDASQGNVTGREEAGYQEAPFSEEDPMYQASKRGYLKPEELQELEHAMEEEKPENLSSALKTLVKLGSVLPWISRAMPGAEGGAGSEMETGLTHEGRHEIANLRMIQYEIRSTVHDHSLQLKRMEEQVIRVRESLESGSQENMDLAESVKSTVKLLRLVGIGLGVLMVVLIVMVGFLMGHK